MFKFTSNEVRDLIISFFVISLSFSILYTGRDFSAMYFILPIVMVGVGLGFILHELGHKFSAMHFGYWSEYQLWPVGLIIALASSSIAGPIVNIVLAIVFLLIATVVYPMAFFNPTMQIIFLVCSLGFTINSYLATFNLIPIWNLDGSKVLRWNGLIWIVTIAISGIMTYLSMTVGVEGIINILIG